jgi:hypothetical protein
MRFAVDQQTTRRLTHSAAVCMPPCSYRGDADTRQPDCQKADGAAHCGMPLHMDISPLHRMVVIVARGHITAEEIAAIKRQLVEANVREYAKIIDASQGTSELTREQVQNVADLLRGAPGGTSRGPVAFIVNPDRIGFANVFTDITKGERPIQLFRSLHEARAWLERTRQGLPDRQAG